MDNYTIFYHKGGKPMTVQANSHKEAIDRGCGISIADKSFGFLEVPCHKGEFLVIGRGGIKEYNMIEM